LKAIGSVLLVIALAAWERPSRQSEGAVVEGTVIDTSGKPVKGVQIVLNRPGQATRRVATDETGRFILNDLIPGEAVFTLSREGYLPSYAAQELSANGRYRRQIVLTPEATISGRIIDSDRKPAAQIEVRLLRDAYDALGQRFLAPLDNRGFARTDEKGEYRITGLPPGNYYIRAAYAAEPARRTIGALFATANYIGSTYYPGVGAPDQALPIKVAAGVNERVVDFSIDPASPFTISGRIVNPLVSTPTDRYSFFLVAQNNRVRDGDGLVPDMDGESERFEFRNIPQGSYDLFVAYRKGQTFGDSFIVGRTSVNVVDSDVRNLTVAVEPGIDVSGTWKSDDPAAGKRHNEVR